MASATGKLYHDTELFGQLTMTPEWREIEIQGRAVIQRDRQMIGLRLTAPAEVDFEAGKIRGADGKFVYPEIRLIGTSGEAYPMAFGNARGKGLASYRPEKPFALNETLQKLQFRCDLPLRVEHVLWTTYNIRDRK